MSELKAYIGPAPDEKGLADYYLKSEADKVIAELKSDIADLRDDKKSTDAILDERKDTIAKLIDIDSDNRSAYYKDLAMMAKEVSHHKYKRCLAMAEWCRESLRLMRTYEVTEDFWNLEPGQDAEYFCKKGDFYSKWRKIWLALAEEPTWAKFLQLIHKEAK